MPKQQMHPHAKSRFLAAKKANILELYIYGQIGQSWYEDGVSATDVAAAIKDAGKITGIKLRINSPGGSVFEGSAIYSLLQSKGVPVDVKIDGLAASAAFTVAMAGTTIAIGESAMMMLHNAWGMCIGEAKDMVAEAKVLEQINEVMATIYSKRSGLDLITVRSLMDAETWLSANDAMEKGFAGEILKADADPDTETAKAAASKWDMSKFARGVPEGLKAAAAVSCVCPCLECMGGDCDSCSDVGCDCDGCGCDQASASAEPNYSLYDLRLRAAAHAV